MNTPFNRRSRGNNGPRPSEDARSVITANQRAQSHNQNPNDYFTPPRQSDHSCHRRGFITVQNNGLVRDNRHEFSNSCFFLSVASGLRALGVRVDPMFLRNDVADFPRGSVQTDTVDHEPNIQRICDHFIVITVK